MPDGESSISSLCVNQEEEDEREEYVTMLPSAPVSSPIESTEVPDEEPDSDASSTPSHTMPSPSPPPEPISCEERSIVANICGAIIRKKFKNKPDKTCSDCLSLLQSSNIDAQDHNLIHLREFKEGALVRPSPAIIKLCCDFEEHFLGFSGTCLPHPHPRSYIIDSFLSNYAILIYSIAVIIIHLCLHSSLIIVMFAFFTG
jgi:hypothetical protein